MFVNGAFKTDMQLNQQPRFTVTHFLLNECPSKKRQCKKNHDTRIANTIRPNSCCCCCCSLSFNAFAVWFCVCFCFFRLCLLDIFSGCCFFFVFVYSLCRIHCCCLNTLNAHSQMMRAHTYNAKERWLMAHTVNVERCVDLFAFVYFALLFFSVLSTIYL